MLIVIDRVRIKEFEAKDSIKVTRNTLASVGPRWPITTTGQHGPEISSTTGGMLEQYSRNSLGNNYISAC